MLHRNLRSTPFTLPRSLYSPSVLLVASETECISGNLSMSDLSGSIHNMSGRCVYLYMDGSELRSVIKQS